MRDGMGFTAETLKEDAVSGEIGAHDLDGDGTPQTRVGRHKSPKIVCWLADTLRECSKLGKTRIITDVSCGMVRNTGFCGQNLSPHVYLELLSIYFL